MTKEPSTPQPELDSWLHHVYPTGCLLEPSRGSIDLHLGKPKFRSLLKAVAGVQAVNAVVETNIGKSHVLRIGIGKPDWEKLNRRLSPSRRVATVEQRGGSLLFWNILLSRLGPFWSSYWNCFRVSHGRVLPSLVQPSTEAVWLTLRSKVAEVLASYDLREIPAELLKHKIEWLVMSRSEDTEPETTSVYDAVFSEI